MSAEGWVGARDGAVCAELTNEPCAGAFYEDQKAASSLNCSIPKPPVSARGQLNPDPPRVAVEADDDIVVRLLRLGWRERVMGAWPSVTRDWFRHRWAMVPGLAVV
jgi:hypothetical protein